MRRVSSRVPACKAAFGSSLKLKGATDTGVRGRLRQQS